MNRSMQLRRLYWKETRQLIPLFALLSLIGLLLQTFVVMGGDRTSHWILFLGLPGLFAAGVGAMLVGQEKEQRTLQWLTSIPVERRDLIAVKYFVGFLGLAGVWAISFGFLLAAARLHGLSLDGMVPATGSFGRDFMLGLTHSILLVLIGFATAWSIRSTFAGLLAMVGIAFFMPILSTIIYALMAWIIKGSVIGTTFSDPVPIEMELIVLSLAGAIAVIFGVRGAYGALGPVKTPPKAGRTEGVTRLLERAPADERRIHTPSAALVWQFVGQNRGLLLGIVGMLLFAFPLFWVFLARELSRQPNGYDQGALHGLLGMLAMFSGFLAISWIGMIVFQSDNISKRIRFLADRGVSPQRVWWTRHIAPATILFVTLLLFVGGTCATAFVSESAPGFIGELILGVVASFLAIYAFTQWAGQLVRSPILGAILAPLVAALPIAYGVFAMDVCEAPWWLLALSVALPFWVTYRMTQPWMDSRSHLGYWFTHLAWLASALFLPTIPFLYHFATFPSVPRSEMVKLEEDYDRVRQQWPFQGGYIIPQRLQYAQVQQGVQESGADPTGENVEENMAVASGMGFVNEELFLREQGKKPAEIRQFTPTQWEDLQWEFLAFQLRNELPVDAMSCRDWIRGVVWTRIGLEEDASEEQIQRYRKRFDLMLRLAKSGRQGERLALQEGADATDAAIVRELQQEKSKEWLGDALYRRAVLQMNDTKSRRDARYRALLGDWKLAQVSGQVSLGRYEMPVENSKMRIVAQRRLSTAVWRMKQLLMADNESDREKSRSELVRLWQVPERTPGEKWYGDWEHQASRLAQDLDPSDKPIPHSTQGN